MRIRRVARLPRTLRTTRGARRGVRRAGRVATVAGRVVKTAAPGLSGVVRVEWQRLRSGRWRTGHKAIRAGRPPVSRAAGAGAKRDVEGAGHLRRQGAIPLLVRRRAVPPRPEPGVPPGGSSPAGELVGTTRCEVRPASLSRRRYSASVRSRASGKSMNMLTSMRTASGWSVACSGRGASTSEHPAAGAHRLAHAGEDAHRVGVVPVVDDAREHVGSRRPRGLTRRSRRRRSRSARIGATAATTPGKVEEHAVEAGGRAQDRREEDSAAAADVDEPPDAGEVVGLGDVGGLLGRAPAIEPWKTASRSGLRPRCSKNGAP